jgi:hypothetical protein
MKEEIAVLKKVPGDRVIGQVDMGNNYNSQIYFSLDNNEVVSINEKTAWDLAFESKGNHVILNYGKGMAACKVFMEFESILAVDDLEWNWDVQTGNLDSTAFGELSVMDGEVYVVDRGYNTEGTHLGYFKLQVLSISTSEIKIAYGDIEATSPLTHTIIRSNKEQFTYFSLENKTVIIAPEDSKYDIIFTQYIELFKEPTMAYLVTGVVLNRNYTSVSQLDQIPFADIKRSDALNLTYSTFINAIGYDWKYYNLEEELYTTTPNQHYIIKTQSGLYFKLRFVGFYSNQGLKGSPTFEFQLL